MAGRRRLALALALVCALAGLGWVASYTLRPNDDGSRARLEHFYAQPRDALDVVFVGSSAVYAFFSPMRLYAGTGLTSALYATPNQTVDMLRFILEECRRTQPDALYVVELRPMLASHEDNARIATDLRRLTDNMPYSLNRFRCIEALAPEEERLSWHADLIKYHGRWSEMSLDDLRAGWGRFDADGGFVLESRVEPIEYRDWRAVNAAIPVEDENEAALRALLEGLRKRPLNVLFIATPFALSRAQQKKYNAVSGILQEYGYEFLNLNDRVQEIGLDFDRDYSDFRHVNILGAVKCTDYMGTLLADSKRPSGGRDRAAWDAALEGYMAREAAAIDEAKEAARHG